MKRTIYFLLTAYIIIAIFTIYRFNGTGDAGDSIQHYLFARYAPLHPQLYFDHWAKPLFVLLASPFAQFGFNGIKVFNALVVLFTLLFTWKAVKNLRIINPEIAVIILIFTPLYFVLTFSGLTEPLFALFLSIGLFLSTIKKFLAATILVSFMPFIRSEGLIFLGVFGLYLLIIKKWKFIPFLLIGHFAYAIAGFFVYADFLWVFKKIPYAKLSSTYGEGKLFHFADKLIYVTGVPIYSLLIVGLVSMVWKSISRRLVPEIGVIVLLGFFGFFIAHSIFWYLGIFNSMGLIRVFIAVVPLIAIIALAGYNFLTAELFRNKLILRRIFQSLIIIYIVVFPFTSNPAAIDWKHDLNLNNDQLLACKTADFILNNQWENHRFVFAHPYLSEVLNVDPFNENEHLPLDALSIENLLPGDIIIWDNWFAVVENGIPFENLKDRQDLTQLFKESVNDKGREIAYAVFLKK